jgi:Flp pilus assembly pilin Flp
MFFLNAERGQGIAEYAFLLTLVFLVVIVVLQLFGISVFDIYTYLVETLVEVFT